MLGMSLGNLFVRIGADTSGLKQGAAEAANFARDIDSKFTAIAKTAAVMGAAVATAAAGIATAMVKASIDSAREITNLATVSGVGTEEFRKLAYASKTVGIEQEKLADIFKDVRDRVGDFLITGGGPMLDFFEQIAPKIGVTAEMFRGLSGPDALLLFKDSLDKANVSAEEQVFFLEAMASDLTNLMPLLANGGEGLKRLGDEAERAGRVLSDVETEQIRQAGVAIQQISGYVSVFADQLTARLAPYLQAVAEYIGEASEEMGGFGTAIDTAISWAIRITAALMDEWRKTQETIVRLRLIWQQAMAGMNAAWAAVVNRVVDGVAVIREAWNSVASVWGADPIPAYSPGMQAFVDQAREAAGETAIAVAETRGQLEELLAKPMPSEGLEEWLANARIASEEAAKLALEARDNILNGGGRPGAGDGTGGKSGEEAAKRAEEMQKRLDALRQSLMTEEEAERASYERRLADLREFLDNRMITQDEYDELEGRAKQEHLQNMEELERDAAERMAQIRSGLLNGMSGMFSAFASLAQSQGEKHFKLAKALSLASAIVKGIEATVAAYAYGNTLGGPPVGAAFAAIAAATSAAQIAQLASTTSSSKSMSGASGGGGGGAVAAAAPAQTLNLSLRGIDPGQLYSGSQVRDLAQALVEYQRDGGQLVIVDT